MEKIIIAVDGPSGAGKSSVTTKLAKKLNIIQLNTGALYRAVGLYCLQKGINPSNEKDVVKELVNMKITIKYIDGKQATFLNGVDVSNNLYTPAVTDACSLSSQFKDVRELILNIQRASSEQQSMIVEGRDIGSVVLPNANFKFYIDASPEVRAMRRINDEKNKNDNLDYETVLRDIIERDRRDMTREISPLVKPEDAIYVNTDNMNIDQVVDYMFNIIRGN